MAVVAGAIGSAVISLAGRVIKEANRSLAAGALLACVLVQLKHHGPQLQLPGIEDS